jgi:hypothetical protein
MPTGVYKRTKTHNENISKALKGRLKSVEHIKKAGDAKRGKKFSNEHKKKLSEAHIGIKLSKYHRKRQSEGMKGKYSKEKSWMWKGGISYLPYSIDWTQTLKRGIRERDRYTCQLCGSPQGDIAHDVHHIDYDKKNCNSNNLITLCRSCNIKVNFDRIKWEKLLKIKVEELNK